MDFDLIRENSQIRNNLKSRIDSLNLSYNKVAIDANTNGLKGITRSSVCKYFKGETKGAITHEQIVWLCVRYGVDIKLKITLLDFDNEKMLNKVKQIF